jgi:hypothetical protein
MIKDEKRTFNLVITATKPTTAFNLCGDQPTAKEGSIILMMKGMPWVVSPGPKRITVVASIKMIVVIPNTIMCPAELNRDPLELTGGNGERPNAWGKIEKHEAHRRILIEMQYTAKNIPRYRNSGVNKQNPIRRMNVP